jgi:hypothetical protein
LKEYNMSGFDTSQPVTEETALKNVDTDEKSDESPQSPGVESPPADPDQLGDATPGPR